VHSLYRAFLYTVLLPVLGMLILCGLLSHQIVGKVCICYLSVCSILLLLLLLFDTGNNMGDWNYFKITQISPEQHTKKARNPGIAKKTATLGTAYCMWKSADGKLENIFNERNNKTGSANCKYRTLTKVYTLETWFVSVYNCKYPAGM
jgi:hypothetical protein